MSIQSKISYSLDSHNESEINNMELTERKIKKIPFNSLGVLAMHIIGIDVKSKMANNTYYSHKRILKAHGFEIGPKKKSATDKTK